MKSHKHSELKILKSATDCLSIKNKYNKSEMYGLETLDAQWAKLGKKVYNWGKLKSVKLKGQNQLLLTEEGQIQSHDGLHLMKILI